ncbi:unnamed protein product [Effrenium voratum]|nr:unnamed protein product [Effrenium voratum]
MRTMRRLSRQYGIPWEEVDNVKRQFDAVDTDRSGYVDFEEFTEVLRKVLQVPAHLELPVNRARYFWKQLDIAGSGKADFAEFLPWWLKYFHHKDGKKMLAKPFEDFYKSVRNLKNPDPPAQKSNQLLDFELDRGCLHAVVVSSLLRRTNLDVEDLAVRREVVTPLGRVVGTDYGDFLGFKGLPFAETPERFEAPQAKRPWTGTWDGSRFGSSCIHGGRLEGEESFEESEDCLFANVWTPKASFPQLLPVVVFIHGGGFMKRSGGCPNFWGDRFVADPTAPAILVTFNYRLGIFGFFSWEGMPANVGFQDQQQLLRWVQQNIHAFGGDPKRVLLSGQSAGAMSVLCHIAAPASAGLFHTAMANSPVGLHYRSREENDLFVRAAAEPLLCFGNVTECLARRPASALRNVDIVPEYARHLTSPCPECANLLVWMPIIDAATLPLNPVVAMERGVHNKVPTILSSVTNETLAFVPSALMRLASNKMAFRKLLQLLFDDRADKVQEHYKKSPDTAGMQWAEIAGVASTDAMMTCYGRYLARTLSTHGHSHLSVFEVKPHSSEMHLNDLCVEGPPLGASCHAGDIAYLIPSSPRMSKSSKVGYANEMESQFAGSYARAIINFAMGNSSFVEYRGDVATSWNLTGPGTLPRYHKDHCSFWEEVGYADVWRSASPSSRVLV